MPETVKQKLGFLVAAMMMVAALAVLNIGSPAGAQAKPCKSGGGGNQTSSPSASPTETEEPFPPSIPPIIPEETESESPSPTETTGGGARNCSSDISLKYKGKTFSGSVKSPEDECEVGRKVLLKKKKKGRDRTIETTVTNRKGGYEMPVAKAKGKYYTKTPKEKVTSDDGPVNCGAAKSNTVKA
jgi:hypothetical protein